MQLECDERWIDVQKYVESVNGTINKWKWIHNDNAEHKRNCNIPTFSLLFFPLAHLPCPTHILAGARQKYEWKNFQRTFECRLEMRGANEKRIALIWKQFSVWVGGEWNWNWMLRSEIIHFVNTEHTRNVAAEQFASGQNLSSQEWIAKMPRSDLQQMCELQMLQLHFELRSSA